MLAPLSNYWGAWPPWPPCPPPPPPPSSYAYAVLALLLPTTRLRFIQTCMKGQRCNVMGTPVCFSRTFSFRKATRTFVFLWPQSFYINLNSTSGDSSSICETSVVRDFMPLFLVTSGHTKNENNSIKKENENNSFKSICKI